MKEKITKQRFEGKGFVLELNYSKKSKDNRLIKFTTDSGESFEVKSDDLTKFIFESFGQKELGIALTTVDVDTVQMVKVLKQVVYEAPEDLEKGSKVLVNFEQWLPYVFATLENVAHKLETESGLVKGIPKKELEKYFNLLKDNNIEFLEKISQKTYPELDKIKNKK